MMFKKSLMATATAAAMVTGAMLAGNVQAVGISASGAGNVLLAPIYDAGVAGYDTTSVRVVNPSLTDAIKAKVILRSRQDSRECADFILYLTPGDVAYFDLKAGTDQNATIWSDDDSLLSAGGNVVTTTSLDSNGNTVITSNFDDSTRFASQAAWTGTTSTVNFLSNHASTDSCQIGHIEVVGAYAARDTVGTDFGNVVIKNGRN